MWSDQYVAPLENWNLTTGAWSGIGVAAAAGVGSLFGNGGGGGGQDGELAKKYPAPQTEWVKPASSFYIDPAWRGSEEAESAPSPVSPVMQNPRRNTAPKVGSQESAYLQKVQVGGRIDRWGAALDVASIVGSVAEVAAYESPVAPLIGAVNIALNGASIMRTYQQYGVSWQTAGAIGLAAFPVGKLERVYRPIANFGKNAASIIYGGMISK